VFVDVDGTLVPQGSSARFIAVRLGHLDAVRVAEDAYLAGEVDNRYVADVDALGWKGASPDEVRSWLPDLPVVDGIQEVVDWCRSHDLLPVLATLAWTVVGDFLCAEYGFAGRSGNELEVASGRFTGRVAGYFDEHDKLAYAREVARAQGIALDACTAIGDARSDVPLFTEAGLSIAFNGDAVARSTARVCIEGDDLRAVLPSLATWLGAAEG
jgi:phosphoserine phosphatase